MTTTDIDSVKVTKYKRGTHPNSQKNLEATKFPKGVSGNAGSGNGYSLTAALKHALKDKKLLQQFIESTIQGAILREPTPFREVWDRIDGKVPDKVDVTSGGESLSDLLLNLRGYAPPQHVGNATPEQLALAQDMVEGEVVG